MPAPRKRIVILAGIGILICGAGAIYAFTSVSAPNVSPEVDSRANEINKSMLADQAKQPQPPPPTPAPPHRGPATVPKGG